VDQLGFHTRHLMDVPSNKHQPNAEVKKYMKRKLVKQAECPKQEKKNKEAEGQAFAIFSHSKDNRDCKRQEDMTRDSSLLFQHLGRDISIHCLLRLSRSDYGSISALNKSFRSLIRSGELHQLRRKLGIEEHWVYFACDLLKWEVFDPNRGRFIQLPKMPCDECFMSCEKESLAVGTELLVFGRELMGPTIHKCDHLSNTWSIGKMLNTPRCSFGSSSLGEIAILAGGCDPCGNILSSAELYNSDTGKRENLPNMNKARKICSGVFMDGKFYVLGGIGADKTTPLTCGEEFDIKTKEWHEIPNMFPVPTGVLEAPPSYGPPPLIAVIKNVLYNADYATKEIKKYDKGNNSWVTIGKFPKQAASMKGWGLTFRPCGDMLIFLGGPFLHCRGMMEINAWVPNERITQWNQLARKKTWSFVYNCTVMGC